MNKKNLNRFDGSVYLCGFMASGKSTIGQSIARSLEWDFRDLDAFIEKGERKKIRDIFDEKGEAYFREKERTYLLELLHQFKGVVSLGGGALQDQQTVDHLKDNGLLVFVETPLDEIVERVHRNTHRPIIFDENGKIKSKDTLFRELKALYSKRIDLYEQAQVRINTSLYPSIEAITEAAVDKIIRHV